MSREKKKGASLDRLTHITDDLHRILCESIIRLLKDALKESGITEEEIKAAREFAELKPGTKAAREFLEFLETEEIQKELMTYNHS
jgi:hypothetical protein